MPPPSLPTTADVAVRSLYLYEAYAASVSSGHTMATEDVAARALGLYYSGTHYGNPSGGEPLDGEDVLVRTLYLYVSIAHDRTLDDVALRALYTYEAYTNDEIFPWIEKIDPGEALPGEQVAIYGDGFGATEAAEGGSVRLGLYDPDIEGPGMVMGVVSWSSRSANLYPANSGIPTAPAIVVTVPDEANSGMLSVEENA